LRGLRSAALRSSAISRAKTCGSGRFIETDPATNRVDSRAPAMHRGVPVAHSRVIAVHWGVIAAHSRVVAVHWGVSVEHSRVVAVHWGVSVEHSE
jgi:hypothetical protein